MSQRTLSAAESDVRRRKEPGCRVVEASLCVDELQRRSR
jgi:hypothetical protein